MKGSQRVDIDGGADDEPADGRDPMVGPPGLPAVPVLCGVLGGVVGFGAEPTGDLVPLDPGFGEVFDVLFDGGGYESLIAPATGRPAPGDDPEAGGSAIAEDCDSAAPPGATS
ncbi:MAG: hypothetical protein AUG49_03440 [Catenulispora sp. 13_1_20CM_3_70_7]|nr:MAG: hypothetical protein AUG49_03440 [Catenulispora sp. 13_1_20CM_3_70_7]